MTFVVVDVEADGPCPGLYSMVSFGAVIVEPGLPRAFYGQTRPISEDWRADALAISGHTREEHLTFPHPLETMRRFDDWLRQQIKTGQKVFISDNPAFDWQFINYYFHRYLDANPFGWSARRIGDMYAGMKGDVQASWKHLRKTKHDHHPVNDAKGNAEALLAMREWGLKFKFPPKDFDY